MTKKQLGYLVSVSTFLFFFGCGKSTSIKPTTRGTSVVQDIPEPTYIPADTSTNTAAQYKYGVGGKVTKDSVAVVSAEIEVTFAVPNSSAASFKTLSGADGTFSMDFNAVTTVDNTSAKICVRLANTQENCQNYTLQKGIRAMFPSITLSSYSVAKTSSPDVFGVSGLLMGEMVVLAGAEVTISAAQLNSSTPLVYVVSTQADGKFTAEFNSPATSDGLNGSVCFKAQGYKDACKSFVMKKGSNINIGTTALLVGASTSTPKTWSFSGKVTLKSGAVIKSSVDSKVSVTFKDTSKNFSMGLAADGTYKKDIAAGAADIAKVCFYPDPKLGLDNPNCIDYNLAANADVQVPVNFVMGSIFYTCSQYAISDSVVVGQSIQVGTNFATSLTDKSRYLVSLESRQADGSSASSTATTDVLTYGWIFNVVGSGWVRYTIQDKQSDAKIICDEKLINVTLPPQGLTARYYDYAWPKRIVDLNPDAAPLASKGTIYSINFNNVAPAGLHRSDNFAMSIDGYIKIDVEGSYTFNKLSDDGIQVFIDDAELMVHDGYYPNSILPGTWFDTNNLAHGWNNGVTRYLTKGLHKFRAKFMQGGGPYAYIMYWKKAGSTSFEIIPASAFYQKQ